MTTTETRGRKMFKRIGAALVVALAGIFGVSGCMPMQGGTPATSTQHQTSVAGLPGVGEDGGLQFTVKGITTASTLGDPNSFIQSTAKGVYVVVSITVKNVSNETHSIDTMNTDALIDSTGRQYDSDYGAATNMSDSSTSTLQPESWAPLREAFDVPIGTTPNAIVMHGGMGTPGVKISLPPLNPSPAATGQ
jgi:Domain of unknown function (DUF4352)